LPSRAEKEAMREEREREKAERELLASPRTPSYKDNSAGMIRYSIMGVVALAVGGAVAMGAFDRPASQEPLGAEQTAAVAPVTPQPQQMAAIDPQQAQPPMGPAASSTAPAPKPAPAPRTAPRPAPAAEAPVPAPLAETAPPIDVDPSTPEVMPAPPEMVAPPAQ
jgi:hypothetical protein